MVYLVAHELRAPRRNYQPLWNRLTELQATRILESVWLLTNAATSLEVRDDLSRFLDANDGLWVSEVISNSAWRGVRITVPQADALFGLGRY
jgi:hypothetical protein